MVGYTRYKADPFDFSLVVSPDQLKKKELCLQLTGIVPKVLNTGGRNDQS